MPYRLYIVNQLSTINLYVWLQENVAICPADGKALKTTECPAVRKLFWIFAKSFFLTIRSILSLFRPTKQSGKQNWLHNSEQLWFLGHRVESTLFPELQRMTRGHDFTQAKYRVSWRVKIPSLQLQSTCILTSISFPKQSEKECFDFETLQPRAAVSYSYLWPALICQTW